MKIKIKDIKNVNKQNICNICRNEKDNGIMIGKSLVCKECENRIIKIDIKNIEYEFYKNKIKEAFLNL